MPEDEPNSPHEAPRSIVRLMRYPEAAKTEHPRYPETAKTEHVRLGASKSDTCVKSGYMRQRRIDLRSFVRIVLASFHSLMQTEKWRCPLPRAIDHDP